jgi:hypothetical protein
MEKFSVGSVGITSWRDTGVFWTHWYTQTISAGLVWKRKILLVTSSCNVQPLVRLGTEFLGSFYCLRNLSGQCHNCGKWSGSQEVCARNSCQGRRKFRWNLMKGQKCQKAGKVRTKLTLWKDVWLNPRWLGVTYPPEWEGVLIKKKKKKASVGPNFVEICGPYEKQLFVRCTYKFKLFTKFCTVLFKKSHLPILKWYPPLRINVNMDTLSVDLMLSVVRGKYIYFLCSESVCSHLLQNCFSIKKCKVVSYLLSLPIPTIGLCLTFLILHS